VLIVGRKASKELLEAFNNAGLETVRKPYPSAALAEVRHKSYDAIVIVDVDPQQDLLEIALSIRDFDERVPMVILNHPEWSAGIDGQLQKLGVHLLRGSPDPREIVSCVMDSVSLSRSPRSMGDEARMGSAPPQTGGHKDE